MRRNVPKRGPARMAELGKKLAQVWLDEEQHKAITAAADRVYMPLAAWVRQIAVWVARGYDPFKLTHRGRPIAVPHEKPAESAGKAKPATRGKGNGVGLRPAKRR